jgi:hypothetical protein
MLSDDLFGRVPLEALCAGIPTDDDPGWVEHIDGVVGNGVDQSAIPPAVVVVVSKGIHVILIDGWYAPTFRAAYGSRIAPLQSETRTSDQA